MLANRTDSGDDFFRVLEGIQEVFIVFPGYGHHGYHDAFSLFSLSQVLPDLFGDERHERVKQLQHLLEEVDGFIIRGPVDRLFETRFDDFQ